MLATFRRASRRAAFEAPIMFEKPQDVVPPGDSAPLNVEVASPVGDHVTVSTRRNRERRRQANV
jgi:hypothetical protein